MTRLKSRQFSAEDKAMSKASAEWKFIVTSFFLVATIAVPTLASLISADDADAPAEMVLRPQEQKGRAPSSLPALGSPKKAVVIESTKAELGNLLTDSSINYDFACSKNKVVDFKVQGAFFQLKGRDCSKGPQPPKLSITNKSNGFTASVFVLNGKEYQTDLIQLQEGMNQISIQYQLPSGQTEEHVLNVKAGSI